MFTQELRPGALSYPFNLCVSYKLTILNHIYIHQTVALVGESGSGKSTVISLLQRFYDPDFGHITLDGIDIQKLQLKWFRQQMGLVSQEPLLFNDTIRDNIAYGKEGDATEAEIVAAAELANAHNFISSLQQVVYYESVPLPLCFHTCMRHLVSCTSLLLFWLRIRILVIIPMETGDSCIRILPCLGK